jgi:hypothetical protein
LCLLHGSNNKKNSKGSGCTKQEIALIFKRVSLLQFQPADCVVELATDFQSFRLLLLILTKRAIILDVLCSLIKGKMELVVVCLINNSLALNK